MRYFLIFRIITNVTCFAVFLTCQIYNEPQRNFCNNKPNRRRTLLGNIEAFGTTFVKLNFSQPKKGKSTKKRKRLSADRKRKEIQKLKCENENLRRKTKRLYKRIQDKIQRETEGFSPNLPETSPSKIQNEPFKPKRKVDSEIREAWVSLSVIPKPIKNKLLFANVIPEEIKIASKNSNSEDQQAIINVISGRTVKKYRQMKTLSEMTMTDRRKLAKVKAKSIKIRNIRKKTFDWKRGPSQGHRLL